MTRCSWIRTRTSGQRAPDRLSASALAAVEDAEIVYLSIASCWEIAIKESIGKLPHLPPLHQLLEDATMFDVGLLNVELRHVLEVAQLPTARHRDPFDRMIAAQARVESLPVVSADSAFDAYGVQRIW